MAYRGAAVAAAALAVLAGSAVTSAGRATGEKGPRYAVRGIYERDSSVSGFDSLASLGFNLIDTSPYADELQPLASRGLKGFVWLGGYDNSTCTFRKSDGWVRTRVAATRRSSAVGAYYIDDEPNAAECPAAPAQIRRRSRLVKSLDRRAPTFIVLYRAEQLRLFAGTVDVIGLDRYPCKRRVDECDYARLDGLIAEADKLGIRYWGIIQAFGDDYYRLPTVAELREQFARWRRTRMEGYLVFSWQYPDDRPDLWLANHPELHAQLALENAR